MKHILDKQLILESFTKDIFGNIVQQSSEVGKAQKTINRGLSEDRQSEINDIINKLRKDKKISHEEHNDVMRNNFNYMKSDRKQEIANMIPKDNHPTREDYNIKSQDIIHIQLLVKKLMVNLSSGHYLNYLINETVC